MIHIGPHTMRVREYNATYAVMEDVPDDVQVVRGLRPLVHVGGCVFFRKRDPCAVWYANRLEAVIAYPQVRYEGIAWKRETREVGPGLRIIESDDSGIFLVETKGRIVDEDGRVVPKAGVVALLHQWSVYEVDGVRVDLRRSL